MSGFLRARAFIYSCPSFSQKYRYQKIVLKLLKRILTQDRAGHWNLETLPSSTGRLSPKRGGDELPGGTE